MSQNRLPGPQKGLSCRMKGICRNTSHRRLRHSLPCLSFSRGLFTVSGLPAVNIGDIRIEGAGSPAKAFLVDFPTVDFGGNAFRFVPVFGYTVQNIVCSVSYTVQNMVRSVMVSHASPNIVAVTVPLGFITLGVQYVGDIAAQYLVAW